MAHPKARTPAYCLHKSSGRAYVTLNGKPIYLGDFDSPESKDKYAQVIGEWIARGRCPAIIAPVDPMNGTTVSELAVQFWRHCQAYYRKADGSATSEVDNFRQAIRPLRAMYGNRPAVEFGPLAMKSLRETLMRPRVETDAKGNSVDRPGWTRKNLNMHMGRIKQIFKWGAENEIVPASIFHALATVSGLQQGRSDARESDPVRPVPDGILAETLKHLSATVLDMVNLQLVSGMRPGELCSMKVKEIDTSGTLWVYKPTTHKTQHHGHERAIYMGKRAREIVARYLKPNVDAHLFSPVEAEAERRRL